ncbi:MAG: hypothetical protein V3R55_02775 [Alphaproteobacteria bacterium]
MKKLALVILLFAGSPSIAAAQTVCVDRAAMLDRLAAEYGEQLTEVKMIENFGLVEVLRSPSKGSWTIILTKPSGISCVLAAGKGLGPFRGDSGSRELGL